MRTLLRAGVRLLVACLVVPLALVAVYRVVDPPFTPLMLIRAVEGAGIERRWVRLDAVSPALLRAVIAAEDARFFTHHGIDLEAVEQARDDNLRHPERHPRGASTITMQCARNVFLWQGRSYVRKALEAYVAVLLELVWGKARILEVYLNVAEWGRGVYGVEAAARRAFGVPARALDRDQAALLAAVLPAPRRLDPAAPTAHLRRRADVITRRASQVDLAPLAAACPGGRCP
jgi:monofunctional biosynthetic peptidoglycan transglycosylase